MASFVTSSNEFLKWYDNHQNSSSTTFVASTGISSVTQIFGLDYCDTFSPVQRWLMFTYL